MIDYLCSYFGANFQVRKVVKKWLEVRRVQRQIGRRASDHRASMKRSAAADAKSGKRPTDVAVPNGSEDICRAGAPMAEDCSANKEMEGE